MQSGIIPTSGSLTYICKVPFATQGDTFTGPGASKEAPVGAIVQPAAAPVGSAQAVTSVPGAQRGGGAGRRPLSKHGTCLDQRPALPGLGQGSGEQTFFSISMEGD